MANRYAVYQLKDEQGCRCLRGRTYEELSGDNGSVESRRYAQIYMSGMEKNDDVHRILKRLIRSLPDGFPGHPIEVADVIVLIVDEWPTAWYVNSLEGGLVLVPGFFRSSKNDSVRLISLDQEEYTINGKEGKWSPVKEFIINEIPFYVMSNTEDPHLLHILVTFDGKIIAEGFHDPDRQEWERAKHHLEKRKADYENGEYNRLFGVPDKVETNKNVKVSLAEQVKGVRKETEDRKKKEKEEEENRRKKRQEQTDRIKTEKKQNAQAQKVLNQIHETAEDENISSQRHGFSGNDMMAYLQEIVRRLDALEKKTGKQFKQENIE